MLTRLEVVEGQDRDSVWKQVLVPARMHAVLQAGSQSEDDIWSRIADPVWRHGYADQVRFQLYGQIRESP